MRISEEHLDSIRRIVRETAGADAQVRIFGSRLNDHSRGGDLDLMVELPHAVETPAELAAILSARISRELYGRKVDVVILAPNLRRLPIHETALREGRII
jgi:predicted nucleotidyltransferase